MCSAAIFAMADSFFLALNWSGTLDYGLGSRLHLFDALLVLCTASEELSDIADRVV